MSKTWIDELEARLASARCSYVGRCNSSRCPLHGGEARALRKLLRVARAAEAALPLLDCEGDCRPGIREHVGRCGELVAALHGEETT